MTLPFAEWMPKAKRYLLQIAMGIKKSTWSLTSVHDCNVIHRDIKSENVLVNEKDEIKIIDFNISSEITSSGMIPLTDKFIGTKTYAPP